MDGYRGTTAVTIVESGRSASPFHRLTLLTAPIPDAARWSIDRMIDAIITEHPDAAMGALLASAIWNGALLDRLRWQPWLEQLSVRDHTSPSWIDLPAHEGADPLRWFVDPMTQLLIERWRRCEQESSAPSLLEPDHCLAAFLQTDGDCHSAFVEQAEWRWRLCLPGMLMEKALGRTPDRGLPERAWLRLLHGAPVSVPKHAAPPRHAREFTAPPECPSAPLPIEELLSRNALKARAEDYRQRSLRQQRNDLVRSATKLPFPQSREGELLHGFVFACLSKLQRTSDGRPYSPSTLGRYASLLRRQVFDCTDRQATAMIDPANLEQRYIAAILRTKGETRDRLINAVEAFDRFVEQYHPELKLADAERISALREQDNAGGIVNIVTGADYYRALAALGTARTFEQRQARLCLILGYRTGLRDRELRALTVDDLLPGSDDNHCDLLIRLKRHAYLKTETSRRILPLHLLLNAEELAELRLWHAERDDRMRHPIPLRMFPTRDRPTRPMPAAFLATHIAPVLRNATGDANAGFGWLRHSFISHLIATLFLPDDGTALSCPSGWRDTDVSLARKRRVMAALVGEERLGQGSLHAVSLLAGHLPTSTTLREYTHSLDWVLGAHVARLTNQPGMTIAQAERLTDASAAAIRKSVQRLPKAGFEQEVAESGYHVPVVVRGRRSRGRATAEAAASVYPDQLLTHGARQRRANTRAARHTVRPAAPALSEVIAWRTMLACVKTALMADDRPAIAAQYGVPPEVLDRWLAARELMLFPASHSPLRGDNVLRNVPKQPHMPSRTVRDRDRHKAITKRWQSHFPRVPTDREADLIDPLWESAMRAAIETIAPGLRVFAFSYDTHRNAIVAKSWEDARHVEHMLEALGATTLVKRSHRPGRGRMPQTEVAIGRGSPPPGVRKNDQIAFALTQKRPARSSGLRQTLTFLAILHLWPGTAPMRGLGFTKTLKRDDAMHHLAP